MNVEDVISCSILNWYQTFKEITFKSIIIPLPCEVVTYLQDKGTLVLPEGCSNASTVANGSTLKSDEDWEEDSSSVVALGPNLDYFNHKIDEAIKDLGERVFPKLNWSSPKDASWISFNKSLECFTAADIYLLLKSSDFVRHDLTSPFENCCDESDCLSAVPYCLALRKWHQINPADEFRCFIRDRKLIGISQRDISQYYINVHANKQSIQEDIVAFWQQNVTNHFAPFSYVMDVHRPSPGHVILVDLNPFGQTTDALFFSWEEEPLTQGCISNDVIPIDSNRLCEDSIANGYSERQNVDTDVDFPAVDFRCVNTATGVQPSPYSRYGLPLDVFHLTTGEDPLKLVDLLNMKIQNGNDDASSEEERD